MSRSLSGIVLSGCLTKTLYKFFISPMHATCPKHPILLEFTTLLIFGVQHKLWSSSWRNIILLYHTCNRPPNFDAGERWMSQTHITHSPSVPHRNSAWSYGRAPHCNSCRPHRGSCEAWAVRCQTSLWSPDPSTCVAAAGGSPHPPTDDSQMSAGAGTGSPALTLPRHCNNSTVCWLWTLLTKNWGATWNYMKRGTLHISNEAPIQMCIVLLCSIGNLWLSYCKAHQML